MRTLKALKSRRAGIEKINKITRAMEVIAATRLHRYEEQVLRFRPYILAQQTVMQNLAFWLNKTNSLWTQTPAQDNRGLVILISSDRGFCGGFNNQLLQSVNNLDAAHTFSFIALGKKGARLLRRQQFNLIQESGLPEAARLPELIREISQKIITSFREERQKVYLIFNKFRRNLLGQGLRRQLFPLELPEEKTAVSDYIFEPDPETALDAMLPLYVHSEIKAAILESQAAEEMARMVTMTQARRNGEDLIKNLTMEYHKMRQAGITKELIEIVNAAAC